MNNMLTYFFLVTRSTCRATVQTPNKLLTCNFNPFAPLSRKLMASSVAGRAFRLRLAGFLGHPVQRSAITWSHYTKRRRFSDAASESASAEGQGIALSDSCVEVMA